VRRWHIAAAVAGSAVFHAGMLLPMVSRRDASAAFRAGHCAVTVELLASVESRAMRSPRPAVTPAPALPAVPAPSAPRPPTPRLTLRRAAQPLPLRRAELTAVAAEAAPMAVSAERLALAPLAACPPAPSPADAAALASALPSPAPPLPQMPKPDVNLPSAAAAVGSADGRSNADSAAADGARGRRGVSAPARPAGDLYPQYPPLARRRGQEGTVVLRWEVLPGGSAGRATVVRSSGHTLLDEAAVAAVRAATFRPATSAGRAVAATMEMAFTFRLVDPDF